MDKLLNYVFIKNGCNQRESDVFVSSYRNKINNLIAYITDANFLIALCPDIESYSSVMHDIDAIAIETVEEQADNQEAKEIVKIAVNELQMA